LSAILAQNRQFVTERAQPCRGRVPEPYWRIDVAGFIFTKIPIDVRLRGPDQLMKSFKSLPPVRRDTYADGGGARIILADSDGIENHASPDANNAGIQLFDVNLTAHAQPGSMAGRRRFGQERGSANPR
jgi:hypothetical protein